MSNEFTRSLLKYSAERDDCIGRPERWGNPPPLVVNTPLHEEMVAFADEVYSNAPRLIWYFMVGGPGNGKSEAVGAFVRGLNSKTQAAGQPPVFHPSMGQHGGTVAYDYHGHLPHGQMWLLQDVSVPMAHGSDPAGDLLASLELCSEGGVHLLACANRGMLLRANREARRLGKVSLVSLLEKIDGASREDSTSDKSKWTENFNGREIEFRVWPLDHESIFFGQGNGNPWSEPAGSLLDQIVTEASASKNWEDQGCAECSAKQLCPMLADAHWLRDSQRRRSFLKILRNAEVWSGQRIVLREALGLLSMVLVGCPSDFVEGNQELHPCEWVKKRVDATQAHAKDELALIELISHRVYQDLFGRSTPTGLAIDRAHQQRDKWITERLGSLDTVGVPVALAIGKLDRNFAKQAGPIRLIGSEGILQPFDPAKDNAWCQKHSLSTDGQISDLRSFGSAHQGNLEREFGNLLQRLEDEARILDAHKDPAKVFAAIYRWASTFYLRLAGTALGETPNSDSLADYLALLQHPQRPIQTASRPKILRDLVKEAAGNDQKVKLAPSFVSDLPPLQLKPGGARARNTNPRWPANDRLLLQVSTGTLSGPSVLLTATTFIDVWRKEVLEVAEWNISPAMENLMKAWRDDFVVAKGQFRNLQAVEFRGDPVLEFEFITQSEIQARPK